MKLDHCLTLYTKSAKWVKGLNHKTWTQSHKTSGGKKVYVYIYVYIYMCVCVCVYIYVYMCVCIYIYGLSSFDITLGNDFFESDTKNKYKIKSNWVELHSPKQLLYSKGNLQQNENTTYGTGENVCILFEV